MVNFTTLTLEQVREYHKVECPHLPIEQLARQARDEYQVRIIIPNWDNHGNHQMFYLQSDGTWMDTVNECTRTQAWIDRHIAPYFKLAPEDISLVDYLKTM